MAKHNVQTQIRQDNEMDTHATDTEKTMRGLLYIILRTPYNNELIIIIIYSNRGGIVFKALRYKQAGCGFDFRWCHWNFSVT